MIHITETEFNIQIVSELMHQRFLSHLLQPFHSIYYNGSLFKNDFNIIIRYFGIIYIITDIKPPQDNDIIERICAVINDVLRVNYSDTHDFDSGNGWGFDRSHFSNSGIYK